MPTFVFTSRLAKSTNGHNLFPDFGFTGHYYHARSGLYLALYRAYSPALGRWLSRDPIDVVSRSAIVPELLPEGPNLYCYVANKTINNVDLLGLQSCDCAGKNGSPFLLSDCWTQYFKDDNREQVSYTNAVQATPTVSFTYDPNYNRVQTMTDGTGTTNYTYYAVISPPALGAGQLKTVDAPPHNNDAITYTYDELGRAVSQSINGVTSSVSYDSLGRLDTRSAA